MRTTLNLDDDVMQAARAIAERRGRSLGTVISELLRQSLVTSPTPGGIRNGIRLFAPRPDEPPVTPELVGRLLAESE